MDERREGGRGERGEGRERGGRRGREGGGGETDQKAWEGGEGGGETDQKAWEGGERGGGGERERERNTDQKACRQPQTDIQTNTQRPREIRKGSSMNYETHCT